MNGEKPATMTLSYGRRSPRWRLVRQGLLALTLIGLTIAAWLNIRPAFLVWQARSKERQVLLTHTELAHTPLVKIDNAGDARLTTRYMRSPQDPISKTRKQMLFVGKRAARDGCERLVEIDYQPSFGDSFFIIKFGCHLYNTGSYISPEIMNVPAQVVPGREPDGLPTDALQVVRIQHGPQNIDFTICAGLPDPNDPSKFTIECIDRGVSRTIVGRLIDGNTVELRLDDPTLSLPLDLRATAPGATTLPAR
ncbi:MAG: hypothetical protein QM770_24375 [Tepidisphaeraceae bacterium]